MECKEDVKRLISLIDQLFLSLRHEIVAHVQCSDNRRRFLKIADIWQMQLKECLARVLKILAGKFRTLIAPLLDSGRR